MSELKKERLEIRIDNAKIAFKNFSGEERKFNPAGNRNFAVFLPDDIARQMEGDGWNVRWLNARPDEDPQAMISVKMNFGNYPPNINLVSDGKMTRLDENTVSVLDFAELEQVDLILRGYTWNVSGKSGVKAYLKTGYFVLVVNELDKKYANDLEPIKEILPETPEDDFDVF
jgi:hypothetical protein